MRLGSGEWEVVPSFRCTHGCQETPRVFQQRGMGPPPICFLKNRLFFKTVKDYFLEWF